jgi:adenylate cyclase
MIKHPEKQKSSRFVRRVSFGISVVLSIVIMLFYGLSRPEFKILPMPGILEIIEAKTLDMRFLWRGTQQPGEHVVIIGVDDKAEGELGRWQSSGRRWLAKLVDILHEAGAKVIGFDFVLVEPGESAALTVADELKKRYVKHHIESDLISRADMLAYFDEVKTNHDYDRQLADAIQRAGNVVLGLYHFWDSKTAQHLTSEDKETFSHIIRRVKYSMFRHPKGAPQEPLRVKKSHGGEVNLPIFSDPAKSFGHFNFVPDSDGFLRRSLLLVEHDGNYYPSLSLEIVRSA